MVEPVFPNRFELDQEAMWQNGSMFTVANISILIALVFLAPLLVAIFWLNRVQICVVLFRMQTAARMLLIRLARTEARLNRELEKRQSLLNAKNVELLDLSKKTRALSAIVTRATNKSEQLQRRLLRKPNDEHLKLKAADQFALAKRLQKNHSDQMRAVAEMRSEINTIGTSIKVVAAHIAKVVAEKHGYVSESHKLKLQSDIRLRAQTHATAKMVARLERAEQRASVPFVHRGPTALDIALKRFEIVERHVVDKEALAEGHEPSYVSSISPADRELVNRMMGNIDRAIVALDYHVGAIFSVLELSDPSIENAYNKLVCQLKDARKFAENSLLEESHLEEHCNQSKTAKELELNSLALRRHRMKNILIDQQLFRADCIARRIFVLRLLISILPVTERDEIVAYKSLLTAFTTYVGQGWKGESKNDAADIKDDLPLRLNALESRIQMTFINLVKTNLGDLIQNKIIALRECVPDIAETVENEIREQKSKLEWWQKVSRDAFENEAELALTVASRRVDQSIEVIDSLDRSREVLMILNAKLQSHGGKVDKVAQ
jgi:hypothetical protein